MTLGLSPEKEGYDTGKAGAKEMLPAPHPGRRERAGQAGFGPDRGARSDPIGRADSGHGGSGLATLAARCSAEQPVSESNPIRIFVSHLFSDDPDYLRVFEFLESVDRFYYLNTSKPENMPTGGGLEAMKDELIAQIKECEAVVVLASHYAANEDLVRYQLDVAEANDKPIIAIRPFGGVAETSIKLVERAREHLEWNERDIADALKRHARLEDTNRWEVIDFP